MKITAAQFQQIKTAKNAEELFDLATAQGLSVTKEQAAGAFAKYFATGSVSDNELGSVAGGGCSSDDTGEPKEGGLVFEFLADNPS